MFKIEKAPKEIKGYTRQVYPFGQMNVGESFFVPFGNSDRRVSNAASTYGKRHALKFSVRIDKDRGGHHVIRVA